MPAANTPQAISAGFNVTPFKAQVPRLTGAQRDGVLAMAQPEPAPGKNMEETRCWARLPLIATLFLGSENLPIDYHDY